MHAKLSPALPSKEQLCQRTCQSMRPVDFEELGLSSKSRCSEFLKKTNLHNPPPGTNIQTIKRWHWKYTKYTLYSIFSSPYLFLGAFLYCPIDRLALSCSFFKMNPRHRGGGAATWELLLWHSGSSRARCNSKRSSCKVEDRMAGRWQDGRFFQETAAVFRSLL